MTMREMKRTKLLRLIWVMVLSLALIAFLAGCGAGGESETLPGDDGAGGTIESAGEEDSESPEARNTEQDTEESNNQGKESTDMANTVIEITMENGGVIDIELNAEAAPATVANFLKLIDEEFYDGLTFHRIIPNFMIQGGCPLGTGTGGADENITGEFASNGFSNPIGHERGVISMARSGNPNSASSQFFITNADASFLDGDYAAFGVVTSGMDVVDEISSVPTGANDKPTSPVVIKTIRRK